MQTEQPQQPPPVPQRTEADWIAADLANNKSKAEQRWQHEQRVALSDQVNLLNKIDLLA